MRFGFIIMMMGLYLLALSACQAKVERKQEMQPIGPHAFQKMEKVWQYEGDSPNSLYRAENDEVFCYFSYSDAGMFCFKKNEPAH